MRTIARSPLGLLIGLLVAGCGPASIFEATAESSSSTTGASTGQPPAETTLPPTPTSTTSSTPPSETTSGATEGSSGFPMEASGDETAATTGSCGFTCPPVPTPPQGACVPPAEGCPEGEKCVPMSLDGGENWSRTVCVPASGDPPGLGEPCTREGSFGVGADNCAAGLLCDGVDARTNEGVCASLCSAFGSLVCPEGTLCSDPFEIGTGLCVAPCDPLGDDCRASEACWPAGLSFGCFYEPSKDAPEPCELDIQCGAGRLCQPADAVTGCEEEACCAEMCAVSEAACGDGGDCLSLGAPLAAHADVGYCAG